MKTKPAIIIGIIVIIAISTTYVSLAYNQEIKLATGMITSDENPQPQKILSDPICFVVDRVTSGEIGSAVTMDACFPLSDFETLECTKPMLEHIYKYTNLLDEEFDGTFLINFVGLPDGVSKEKYEKCTDAIFEKRKSMAKNMEFESFTIVEGTRINLEGIIVDMRLDSAHQYSLFTNDPRYTFNTGSNGINLVGISHENDLNGKIVKLSGIRTQRDLGIKVDDYKIISSLVPSLENLDVSNAKDILNVSLDELYGNPDQYYNRFVRVTGDLSEYENGIAYAGVGCHTAKYTTSDEFFSDFPSSRHLQDGDKYIGVRIGTSDDLGKVNNPLPDKLKTNKVTVIGVFVPNVVERGHCDHTIHKSGYVLAQFENIEVVG